MPEVELWIAAYCPEPDGPGGWGAILRYGVHSRGIDGQHRHTNADECRRIAVHMALIKLHRRCAVIVHAAMPASFAPATQGPQHDITWRPATKPHPNAQAAERMAIAAYKRAQPANTRGRITRDMRQAYHNAK